MHFVSVVLADLQGHHGWKALAILRMARSGFFAVTAPKNTKRHPADRTIQFDMMIGKAIIRAFHQPMPINMIGLSIPEEMVRFPRPGQISKIMSSPVAKNISLNMKAKSPAYLVRLTRRRGGSRSSRTLR
jgi:hypothetical protein